MSKVDLSADRAATWRVIGIDPEKAERDDCWLAPSVAAWHEDAITQIKAQMMAERERANNAEHRCSETQRNYDELSRKYEAAVTQANESEKELQLLHADIEDYLPEYALDDGTGEPANYRERIEYAGKELQKDCVLKSGKT